MSITITECEGCGDDIDVTEKGERTYHVSGYELCSDCWHKAICPKCGPLHIDGGVIDEKVWRPE